MICWTGFSAGFALASDNKECPVADPFTVALVQMRCEADLEANMAKAIAKIREAGAAGAQIVCLPELFLGHYFCQREDPALFDLAEPIPGPSTRAPGQGRQGRRHRRGGVAL